MGREVERAALAMLVGIWDYVIGSFVGILVTEVLIKLHGGK